MNFKNLSENLKIVIVATSVGAVLGYLASTQANKQAIELLRPTIEQAIRKETTSITNEFKTEIKKLKNKKGVLDFNVKPILESAIEQNKDSVRKKTKKKFLGIF